MFGKLQLIGAIMSTAYSLVRALLKLKKEFDSKEIARLQDDLSRAVSRVRNEEARKDLLALAAKLGKLRQ